MKTLLNPQTSFRLFEIAEDQMCFEPIGKTHPQDCTCGGHGFMQLDVLDKYMDGVFPTKASWTRFANSVDREGGPRVLSWMLGGSNRKKADIGYCIIQRQSRFDDDCTMIFKKPVEMVVGGYRSNDGNWISIVEEVDYLKGNITYEWLWDRNDDKASCIETYLQVSDFGKRRCEEAA